MLVILSLAPDGRLALKSRYDAGLVDVIKRVCPTFYTAFCHDCEHMSLTC
jgi:hypothetical protein